MNVILTPPKHSVYYVALWSILELCVELTNPILPPHVYLVGRIYYSGVTVACNLSMQRTTS